MPTPLRRRGSMPVAVLLICLLGSTTFAQTDAYWLNAADGDWSTASNWSTDPIYPNNGSPTASDTYNVTIDASGAAYTVTLDTDITLDNLTLNSSDQMLVTNQDMDISGTLNIQAGSFRPVSGTLRHATIIGGPDASVNIRGLSYSSTARPAFNNVTTYIPVTVEAYGINSNALYFINDLSIENTSLTINDELICAGVNTRLISSTHGEVLLSGEVQLWTDGVALTIGPNVTLQNEGHTAHLGIFFAGTITNQGVIHTEGTSETTDYRRLTVMASQFTNEGLFEVGPHSTAIINAKDWTNTGTIRLTDGTLTLGGNFTMADVGALERTGGTVNLAGILDNTGQTLTLDAFGGGWQLTSALNTSGAIQGGQVAADGDRELIVAYAANGAPGDIGGHLVDIDVYPDVRVMPGARLSVDGTTQLLGGHVTIEGNGSVAFENDIDDLTIDFVNPANGAGRIFTYSESITLGPNMLIHADGAQGILGSNSSTNMVVNQGTILIDSPDSAITFRVSGRNEGVIELTDGVLRLGDDGSAMSMDALGTVQRTGGRIILNAWLNEPDGVFDIDSTYGSIDLGARGAIVGKTINTAMGYRLAAAETGAVIEDSIMNGELVILSGVLLETNSCELATGSTLYLEGSASGEAVLRGYGTTGAGEIVFNGTDNANRINGWTTIGTDLTLRTGTTGGHLQFSENYGHIQIDNPNATVYWEREFYNYGQITMSAGTLVLDGSDGYSSVIYGTGLGDIQVTGGSVLITTSALNLENRDIDLDKLGSVEVYDDVHIYGGDIISTGANELVIRGQNVLFEDGQIDADMRVLAGGQLTVWGSIAEGRRLTLVGDATGTATASAPTSGITVFDGSDNANRANIFDLNADGVIRTGTTGGAIVISSFGSNYGSIIADTAGAKITLTLYSLWFSNRGLVLIGDNTEVTVQYDNPGTPLSPLYRQYVGATRLEGGVFRSPDGIRLYGGTLEGNGDIVGDVELAMTGSIAPGLSAGVLNLDGDLLISSSTASLTMQLGGTAVGSEYDRLAVTGSATLAGTLDVTLINAFEPAYADRFVVLTAGSIGGAFELVNLPAPNTGLAWKIVQTNDRYELRVMGTGDLAVGANQSVNVGGGTSNTGGVEATFDSVSAGGQFTADHVNVDAGADLTEFEFSSFNFQLAGDTVQLWDLSFDGTFDGNVILSLVYDESLLAPEQDEAELAIYHYTGGDWELLPTLAIDTFANIITVQTDGFSPFALGSTAAVPAPAALPAGLALMGLMNIKRRPANRYSSKNSD